MLGCDLTVKILNKTALDYYGLSEHEKPIGQPCHKGLRGNREPCAECFIVPSLLNGHGGTFERKGITDGSRLEKVVLYPLKKGEEVSGAIIRISDVTEAKILERRMVQNEKLTVLGLLVASIAHDINNPNNFISFNIPILREYLNELLPIVDDYAEGHPGYELFGMSYPEFRTDLSKLLDNLEHGSSRIKTIVSDLREFVRKRHKREERFVDLEDLANKAIAICGPEIAKKVKRFEVSIPAGLPQTLTCPEDLELVLVNLLINAAQAADKEDSWIKLSIVQGDHLCIKVSDNGCGMDEETKERAFHPLFTTKPSSDGFGLGLYVCNSLVEGLGGSMEMETAAGKGSSFRVTLHEPKFEDEHGDRPGSTVS